jgi:RND family efflux transporter MFP subunit
VAITRRSIRGAAWLAVLTSVALLSGCSQHKTSAATPTASPALPVQVQTVTSTRIPSGVTYLGSITPYIQTTLAPAASGNLAEVNVRPGQAVVKGQLLAKLSNVVNVPAINAVKQAAVALQNSQILYQNAKQQYQQAKVQYQDALAMFNDHLSSDQQVVSAKNAVNEQLSALNLAKVNLQKAQLQANMSLGGGNTPQDLQALQAVVASDQKALSSAQQQLSLSQGNLVILTNAYQTAKNQYGAITQAQVEQAAQAYHQMLSNYQAWQNGAFAGSNPYATALSADNTTYQTLNTEYSALQQAQQQYNSGVSAVTSAQNAVNSAQSNLIQAQKSLTDANPPSGSNAANLAQMGVTAAQASLQQAQTQYNAAQTSLQLTQQLAADRIQAKQSLAQAVQSLNQARQAFNQAANTVAQNKVSYQTSNTSLQVQITDGQVITPISGLVQSVNAQVGQSVGPQTQLITIASDNPVMATINVPAGDIGKMVKGTLISIDIPSLNQRVQGHVLDIHPQLNTANNEYPVDVIIDGIHAGLLPGLQVQAQLTKALSSPAIVVPADAVLSLQSGAEEVFVLNGNKVHAQIVQVGTMRSTTYQITSGLHVGQKIVVAGQNLLSDGNTVKVVPTTGSKEK